MRCVCVCEEKGEVINKTLKTNKATDLWTGAHPPRIATHMCSRDCIVDQCTEDSCIITVYCICTKQQGSPSVGLFRAERVAQDQDDGITAQKHLRNESFARHGLHFALAALGNFCPDLAYVLQHHVAVTIKCLNTRQ